MDEFVAAIAAPLTKTLADASDPFYSLFEKLIAQRVKTAVGPFFTVNAETLWSIYLQAIPSHLRQHYTCRCCQRFIERYGNLAAIREDGVHESILWGPSHVDLGFFNEVMKQLHWMVRQCKVVGVFINDCSQWGTESNDKSYTSPGTGDSYVKTWTHLHGFPALTRCGGVQTADQVMAEKKQDFIILSKALDDYSFSAAMQALRVLEADTLDRSEKTLGVAKWFFELHQDTQNLHGGEEDNQIWLAVAKAPPGFCHIGNTMISTLLDDIVAGLPFEEISRRWAAKMHPAKYQQPTTVKDGNIAQAEKIIAQLGSAGALRRRFARLEEVRQHALWTPEPAGGESVAAEPGGVFGHLRSKTSEVEPMVVEGGSITWRKFSEKVLPKALSIEVKVPYSSTSFYGLVTAVDPEAPPILQWDGLTYPDGQPLPRNPVSWFYYLQPRLSSQWNLQPASWALVSAVFLSPSKWQQPGKFSHHAGMALFALRGCRPLEHTVGAGFFKEFLKADYYSIGHVMQAYAVKAAIEGLNEGDANGIACADQGSFLISLRVNDGGGLTTYDLDRWD